MAVPSGVSVRRLDGKFEFNKKLSDSDDKMLDLQGIGWIMRQAIKHSGVTLNLHTKTDEKGVTHLDIEQVASGGYKNWEYRPMDWEFQEKEDGAYGKIKLRSRFCDVSEISNDFLKKGFSGEVINTYSESVGLKGDQWQADQVWGIETVDGAPRYVPVLITMSLDHTNHGSDTLATFTSLVATRFTTSGRSTTGRHEQSIMDMIYPRILSDQFNVILIRRCWSCYVHIVSLNEHSQMQTTPYRICGTSVPISERLHSSASPPQA